MIFPAPGVSVFNTHAVCSFRFKLDDRVRGRHDGLVVDEVSQMRILLLADRRFQRDRDLFGSGVTAELLDQRA